MQLNGSILVSAAADATIRVWDPNTGECLQILGDHPSGMGQLITAIQCIGGRVTAGSYGAVQTWNIRTGDPLHEAKEVEDVWQILDYGEQGMP
ncbi:hypothetical protein BGX23_010898 [Mortierella sp. AD031]|nr:hypothetical protein BGX23_010898 [Mortierella sp. AD031]KAG0198284.1 hypothetical protein BGX33_012471 [Mortierella sp. NVP41]